MDTSGGYKLKGNAAANIFMASDGDDRIIGRGGADVFHGGSGDDIIEIRNLEFQLVDGVASYETVDLDRSHLDLNLVDFRGKISNIEAIDMTSHGRN